MTTSRENQKGVWMASIKQHHHIHLIKNRVLPQRQGPNQRCELLAC